MVPHARQMCVRYLSERAYLASYAQLLFWRSHACGTVTAERLRRSARRRYCWLHHERAQVVIPKPYIYVWTPDAGRNDGANGVCRCAPRDAEIGESFCGPRVSLLVTE